MSDFGRKYPGSGAGGDDRRRSEEFVQDVLARTSGQACRRALDQLPDLTDHRLEDLDRQLVQAHLEHCVACRQVAVTLGWLGSLLPDMAEVEPGPAFTAAVVARTSGALSRAEKTVRAGGNYGPAGLLDRLGRWWQGQLQRPQFALQFAYVATVLILALTATPWSPLRGAPRQALGVVQAGPGEIPVVSTVLGWGQAGLQPLLDGAGQGLDQGRSRVMDSWNVREERSRQARWETGDHLSKGWRHLREQELSEAGYEGLQAVRRAGQAWRQWWRSPQPSGTLENSTNSAGRPAP